MVRIARIVVPGLPHYVAQRGYEGQQAFFGPEDYALYLRLASEALDENKVKALAWSLLFNRVSLLVVPSSEEGLARALGEVHRRYSREVNARLGREGRLWHARFNSFTIEEPLIAETAKYVELQPVRTGLVLTPAAYPWSSATARLAKTADPLGAPATLPGVSDWSSYIAEPVSKDFAKKLAQHESTGRPMGTEPFILGLEGKLGKRLRPRKRGRKPKIPRIED